MANNPRIDIGVKVDYKDVLEQMRSDFKKELTEISNQSKKTKFDSDIKKQLTEIKNSVSETFDYFEKKFDQKIDTETFKTLETDVTTKLESMRTKISNFVSDVNEKIGMIDGSDFASGMKKQFDDVQQTITQTLKGLEGIIDLTKVSGKSPAIDESSLKKYKETLAVVNRLSSQTFRTPSGAWGQLKKVMNEQEDLLKEQIQSYDELKAKMSAIDPSTKEYIELENELVRIQAQADATAGKIQNIFNYAEKSGFRPTYKEGTGALISRTESFLEEISAFENKVEGIINANKEARESLEQTQASFNTFQIKDGAIHIPIDIATSSEDLQSKYNDIIKELGDYAKNKPIIAQVKLVLDKSSSKGYEKNSEIDKQQAEGQNEPALDISKTIQNTYRKAAREAKQIVKTEIATIEKEFESVSIKIKPDTDAFTDELKAMINKSFEAIANETTGVKVNEELEKLVTNLKEVSSSLSGNENFKFGLDEASIERITAAIKDMADMIQRAFGVASNDDIAAQWASIESKFKGVAGEEGKLLKGNKEHKIAIQELAVEYKKYLDMGGKNDLSELTAHKQTVKNIAAEYENLGKAAQEAAQKQEQVTKKPASAKVSSEEKDAIKGVTKQNKNLEEQAVKTGTALDNEGKKAQSAAEKFRKLAKEKGAAVVANRELAKAAKETADALEREAKIRKEAGTKTGKGAVDDVLYADNFLKWQFDIEKSMRDSGNYADVYEAKVSQATNGTVKFTAVVRTLDGALKKFSATVKDSGEISSPSISVMPEDQAAKFEKRLKVAEKIREAIASMDGEGVEPIRLDRSDLELYSDEIQRVLKELEELSGTTYKVDITSGGKLAITRKEIADSGAEAEQFTIIIDRIDSIFEETADGIVVSSSKIEEALNSAFDSAKISTSTKDLAASAQKAFDVFEERAKRDSNFSQIESGLESLRRQIATIGSQKGLNKFNQDLKDLGATLKNVGKDAKLGEIIPGSKSFEDINEVRANIDSLFATIGKVNEKSIRVTGTNKLTAEVRAANGEIRKMNVSLDSKGFARYVDAGIVQFGRLRTAAEGVFKGIKDMVRIYLSPQDFIRYFRQGFDAVREIDTAMTELRKVSDASPYAIDAYFDTAASSAKELGSSVNEMIGATADWSRNGYNLPDAHKLAEVAVLYKNVGDGIDIETANESLISTLQGFQLEASEAESIVDSFNAVSNNFSISSGGIGEALKRSAAAFNAANTDLNQSIALITAGNEVVQNPEKVGRAMPTCTVMY